MNRFVKVCYLQLYWSKTYFSFICLALLASIFLLLLRLNNRYLLRPACSTLGLAFNDLMIAHSRIVSPTYEGTIHSGLESMTNNMPLNHTSSHDSYDQQTGLTFILNIYKFDQI